MANSNKILMLFGPRQVGKTTLARKILANFEGKTLEVNADILQYSEVLKSRDIRRLGGLVEGYDLLFIDEAQRIPDIGINLKILFDQFPDLQILVTGSSSLELANQTREALTGRTLTYQLFPVAVQELKQVLTPFDLHQRQEEFLIFGMYPDILQQQNRETKTRYLRELVGAYLYKDILELTNIKHSEKLGDLLRLLAFQIGSQVSLTELGKQLGLAKETVETYLDLLEKSFVIFKLRGFSRNLRKEVSKMNKYYFYDLGVRNTLIENFNLPNYRGDMGQLWENFLMVERLKYQAYTLSAS
ncbi:MAG: ATP-binding protein, partial [Bacteroidota bacterium]